MCLEFETGGYAVLYKDTLELLEYSPTKSISELRENDYYCGPNNFFRKNENQFVNIYANDITFQNSATLKEKAGFVRDVFSKKSKKSVAIDGLKISSASGETGPKIDPDNYIKLDYGTLIPNSTFFTINPWHGTNKTGTCGAIAAEMMLSYHNYYSDRRIIPDKYLNGNSTTLKEDNPNYCSDPMKMTRKTLGARGLSEIDDGDSNNYFAKIVKAIPKNASYPAVSSGIKSILLDRNCGLTDTIKFNVHYKGIPFGLMPVNTSGVKTMIDKGNPSILLLQGHLGALDHYVVAYGYSEYTYPNTHDTYAGFITNFGWGNEDVNIWVNESWICAYITMSIEHEHEYIDNGMILGTNRAEFKCNICGHRTDAAIIETNSSNQRYNERFVSFPLNKDLYNRVNDDDYLIKRDYYKYYHFKPRRTCNRLVQTFCNQSTTITILDSDKKTVLCESSNNGYYRNAFLNYKFKASKIYYIMINLFPLRSSADVKLVMTPVETAYSSFQTIPQLNGDNETRTMYLNGNGTCVFAFTPTVGGSFRFKTSSDVDTVLYISYATNGSKEAFFDDDSGGNNQPSLVTAYLGTSITIFVVVSPYSLFSSDVGTINLIIEKV